MVIGFPSFTAESTVAIVTIGFNIAFVQYAGELGVASYAMVNSIHAMTLLLFFGVGAALQPMLVSITVQTYQKDCVKDYG